MELDGRRDAGVPPSRGMRPEIQALRALAVGIVVVYHFWPSRLPGGYVGVDVFFVISGFLITTHLLGEYRKAGRIDLPRFWARRARRLLPASLVVLGVVALASPLLLPGAQLQEAYKQIAASALYVQNWVLAAESVDYLAAENAASPVQHFWSLSVEEQFYIFVPILLVVAATLIRHKRTMLIALAAIAIVSFAYSVSETTATPGVAYFATTTRAWEFAAGGLLVFVATPTTFPRVRAIVSWLGWVGLIVVAFAYNSATPFPGYTAALPVAATLAVIWAGRSHLVWSPERFLAIRPATFLGDISYSVYLWHWPVLIFAGPQPWAVKIVLIGAVVFISWLSWTYVENPFRRARIGVPRYTFVAAAAAMAIVVVPVAVGWDHHRRTAAAEVAEAQARAAEAEACFGAQADRSCAHTELVPSPANAFDDRAEAYDDGCIVTVPSMDFTTCEYGTAGGDFRVAVIGDSHAVAWLPAVRTLADEHGWSLTSYLKSGCPYSTARKLTDDVSISDSCESWNEKVRTHSTEVEPYDLVFVTHSANGARYGSDEVAVEGFRTAWESFVARGSHVVVIRDTPRMTADTLGCLERNERTPSRCAVPAEDSIPPRDLMVDAAHGEDSVTVVDVTDVFCWDGNCHGAVGGVITHRDPHHLTRTFAITLAPILEQQLVDADVLPESRGADAGE